MANFGGTFPNDSRYTINLAVSETLPSNYLSTNKSIVNYTLTATKSSGSGSWDYTAENPIYVGINGVTKENRNVSYDFTGSTPKTITLASGSQEVTHNSDGSKTIYVSASFTDNGNGKGTASCGGNFTLTKIPRQANITNAPDFNDEENPTITYSNPAGNSVTTLQACISLTGAQDDIEYRDISKTGTSYTFELTNEERELLRNATPNSNTLPVRFYVKTVLGSSTYYNYQTKNMSIINGNPVFENFDVYDINPTTIALTGSTHDNVNGYSTIRAYIPVAYKAEAQKGASMSSYRFVIGANTPVVVDYDDSDTVYLDIPNASNGTYQLYAIDSRGNSTLVTKFAVHEIDYKDIYINGSASKVERDDGSVGTHAILTYSGTIWNNSFGSESNAIVSTSYQYKETSSSTWITPSSPTTITPTITDNTFSFSAQVRSNAQDYTFDVQKSYDFKVTITDKLSTYEIELTPMPSGTPNISLNENGVGIMCDYDEDVGGVLQINGKQYLDYDVVEEWSD